MNFEEISAFSTPLIIYIVMGIFITRIQLDQVNPRGYKWLQWMQFVVDVLKNVLLWPLVLFIEKSQQWLASTAPLEEVNPVKELVSATANKTSK
ncbi:MAG: hypothetical protein FP831_16775 [Anaerolineae bacterium]|nr:hypothetical protein [Anaerolineae bacterium]